MVRVVGGSVLVYVLLSRMASQVGPIQGFDDMQSVVGADLLSRGYFPWSDFLFIHGLFEDALRSSVGFGLFERSLWGTYAALGMVWIPLTWLGVYWIGIWASRGRAAPLLAVTVLLVWGAVHVGPSYRWVAMSVVWLLLGEAVRRGTWPWTALLTADDVHRGRAGARDVVPGDRCDGRAGRQRPRAPRRGREPVASAGPHQGLCRRRRSSARCSGASTSPRRARWARSSTTTWCSGPVTPSLVPCPSPTWPPACSSAASWWCVVVAGLTLWPTGHRPGAPKAAQLPPLGRVRCRPHHRAVRREGAGPLRRRPSAPGGDRGDAAVGDLGRAGADRPDDRFRCWFRGPAAQSAGGGWPR